MFKTELKEKTKLIDHIHNLENSKNKYTYVMDDKEEKIKLKNRLAYHLKDGGYKIPKKAKDYDTLLDKYIKYIFETQDSKPFYYFDAKYLTCWNRPKNWKNIDYIKYEWGHLYPSGKKENNEDVDILENLSLQSGRCNDHIQSGLSVDRVKIYEGKLKDRIEYVQKKREELFESEEWKKLKTEFSKYKVQ
ncbi:MAG: hypothetical protein MJ176_10665 [Treponema sp.]|nr:hypothetical protein [Treponema sp.]